ncbi:MAG: hypothetical protein Q4C31_01375 [Eubacteriales bacterium]|nr:hypothetical protein [Eubacteriales bacterium]
MKRMLCLALIALLLLAGTEVFAEETAVCGEYQLNLTPEMELKPLQDGFSVYMDACAFTFFRYHYEEAGLTRSEWEESCREAPKMFLQSIFSWMYDWYLEDGSAFYEEVEVEHGALEDGSAALRARGSVSPQVTDGVFDILLVLHEDGWLTVQGLQFESDADDLGEKQRLLMENLARDGAPTGNFVPEAPVSGVEMGGYSCAVPEGWRGEDYGRMYGFQTPAGAALSLQTFEFDSLHGSYEEMRSRCGDEYGILDFHMDMILAAPGEDGEDLYQETAREYAVTSDGRALAFYGGTLASGGAFCGCMLLSSDGILSMLLRDEAGTQESAREDVEQFLAGVTGDGVSMGDYTPATR